MIMDDNDGQMIFGDLVGLKLPDICLTGEEKIPKKPHPGNLSDPGIEPGPSAWQARMLLPVPQRWTIPSIYLQIPPVFFSRYFFFHRPFPGFPWSPFLFIPWGFQLHTSLCMAPVGFLSVYAIYLHFHFLICISTSSWFVISHRELSDFYLAILYLKCVASTYSQNF